MTAENRNELGKILGLGDDFRQSATPPVMKLQTRVFELMWENYTSLPQLARAMGVSHDLVYRVKDGRYKISATFIVGAVKAFPEYKLDDLFYVGPQGRETASAAMLTTAEVAQLLGIRPNTVRRWNKRGILKSYRLGSRGDRRFRREDIDDFLKQGFND